MASKLGERCLRDAVLGFPAHEFRVVGNGHTPRTGSSDERAIGFSRVAVRRIRCPTLILAGGRDPICSLTATLWMSDRIPGAETVIFENSSHFFLVEEAEKFQGILSDWLRRHAP